MKRVFIIRHAKSSWEEPNLKDFDRKLSKRGKKDIKLIAKWLKDEGYKPDLIISSPAKRAKKTLEKIVKILDIDKSKILFNKKIYEASREDLLKILEKIDDKYDNIFLIGHNPALNELAEFLTNSVIFNIPTSGVFCIEFDIKKWSEIKKKKGKILFFEYPKKLKESMKR